MRLLGGHQAKSVIDGLGSHGITACHLSRQDGDASAESAELRQVRPCRPPRGPSGNGPVNTYW